MTFRPMLAVDYGKLKTLRLPAIGMPKIDGIRCVIMGGRALSRSLKPIRNLATYHKFSLPMLDGLDGELIVGNPAAPDAYRRTVSSVMSYEGDDHAKFYVFDHFLQPEMPYEGRLDDIYHHLDADTRIKHSVEILPSYYLETAEDVVKFEQSMLAQGFEGIVLRHPKGTYKYGRSTPAEQGMVKKKAFLDSDAVIVGAVELKHNNNVVQTNALGLSERSSHQDNKVGGDTLGALIVRDLETGMEFNVGTGFIAAERDLLWQAHRKANLIGRIIKYKYFPVGVKDLPRHPVFMGFRDKDDL